MKKNSLLVILLCVLALISCKKDLSETLEETGKIHIEVGSNINILEMDGGFKTDPVVEDFKVDVYNADGSPAISFERAEEMPDTIELAVGDYYVQAYSDNDLPAEFDNPYYFGATQVFTVTSNQHLLIEVNCTLSNTVVSVIYSDNVVNSFLDYSTMVASEYGSLLFSSTETRKGYFRTSPLDITVDLEYTKPDGTHINRILAGSIPSPLPNKHYQISVDASITDGMASFLITQDTSDVLVEIVELSDNQDTTQAGAVAYGELLICEIMPDPSALSDTEGEWFEIYNTSDKSINLRNLILSRDDTNLHTITDSIVLAPGEYYLLSRTAQAADVSNMYIYGTAITLSNAGAILSIYNEEIEGNPGEIIFSVNYGDSGFPNGSGASISLNPFLMNTVSAVLGSSWCLSTSSYNTGDLGTPGESNDACQ